MYQKANASGAGEGEKNMTVWDVSTGAKVYECFQKAFNKAEWPYIQFSADDSVACRVVTNEAGTLRHRQSEHSCHYYSITHRLCFLPV